jgi:hypothetical protein
MFVVRRLSAVTRRSGLTSKVQQLVLRYSQSLFTIFSELFIQANRYMSTTIKPSKDEIINILRTCQAVCVDGDRTVIPVAGIDELAAYKGVGNEVSELTRQYVFLKF